MSFSLPPLKSYSNADVSPHLSPPLYYELFEGKIHDLLITQSPVPAKGPDI